MLSLFILSTFFILGTFCLVFFSFMTVILMVEILNVSLLLFSYLCCTNASRVIYLIFIVVATIEVIVALVCLSRLWDTDFLVY